MLDNTQQPITVIGHVNPDTDSICSAIAYADLKTTTTNTLHEAGRAGNVNPETAFVLKRFSVNVPEYIDDVRPRVKDIEIRKMKGVDKNISLRRAWEIMSSHIIVTLPIVNSQGNLEGLITMGDITRSYMEVYDNRIIADAQTPYKNILDTLNGKLLVGEETGIITRGKVIIAAANPDVMEDYIEEDDIVILGNRYESQLCAIEMNAACIVISNDAKVSRTICKLAQENNCRIIQSPYDTYTIARLMNQSIPIRHFMCKEHLLTFTEDDFVDDVKVVMAEKRHRYFPILNPYGKYEGMISRRNLLSAKKRRMILVDHNEKSQAVPGLEDAEILEIIDHHKIGNIETIEPVYFRNQPLGCTATIIYQIYQENCIDISKEIAGLLCSAILSDTLAFRSPTCTQLDKKIAENLAKIAEITDIEAYACEMFAAGSNLTDKSATEIFYQDFKKFNAGDIAFGVGQISSMSEDELKDVKSKLMPVMEKFAAEQKSEMIFFMLTNIMKESSELLFFGNESEIIVENAFGLQAMQNSVNLAGVVSRKKQLIPRLMKAFQRK